MCAYTWARRDPELISAVSCSGGSPTTQHYPETPWSAHLHDQKGSGVDHAKGHSDSVEAPVFPGSLFLVALSFALTFITHFSFPLVSQAFSVLLMPGPISYELFPQMDLREIGRCSFGHGPFSMVPR